MRGSASRRADFGEIQVGAEERLLDYLAMRLHSWTDVVPSVVAGIWIGIVE